MRVLHVDTGREMRGGQRQVILLLEELKTRGVQSDLLANARGSLYQYADERGWAPRSATLWNVMKSSTRAELVHVHDSRSHTLAALGSRKPVVVSRRVTFPIQRSWLSRWKYRRASRFLAVSAAVAQELRNSGVENARISVVPDGVRPCNFCYEWNREWPVVTSASDELAKGADLVAKASVLTATPIVASRDLERDLQKARAFLYISRSEGLGSAALLAMSMGVPVIASHIGGLAEIFEDGVSGVYVENDPKTIADAVDRLALNPERSQQIGCAGRARVRQNFSADLLAERTLAAYRSAL